MWVCSVSLGIRAGSAWRLAALIPELSPSLRFFIQSTPGGARDAWGRQTERVCESCGRPYTPTRAWQRGCGFPACRAATSRRRHQQAILRAFEQIDQALARPDIAAARIIIRAQLRKLA